MCQFSQGRPHASIWCVCVCVCVEYARVTRHYASIQACVKRTDRDQAFSLVIIPICWKMWPAPRDNTRLFRIIGRSCRSRLAHVVIMSLRKDGVIIIHFQFRFLLFYKVLINHLGSIALWYLLIKRIGHFVRMEGCRYKCVGCKA